MKFSVLFLRSDWTYTMVKTNDTSIGSRGTYIYTAPYDIPIAIAWELGQWTDAMTVTPSSGTATRISLVNTDSWGGCVWIINNIAANSTIRFYDVPSSFSLIVFHK